MTRIVRDGSDNMAYDDETSMNHAEDCFDPATCCDAHEQTMIAMMRHYLRPESAPECLYERLRVTLDRCCEGEEQHITIEHITIHDNGR